MEAQNAQPAAGAQQDAMLFEGQGLQAATAKCALQDEQDDEFSYAFDGGQRLGNIHRKEFKPAPMPAHLLSNVRQQALTAVGESGVEEDEEGEQEEEQTSQPGVANSNLGVATRFPAPFTHPHLQVATPAGSFSYPASSLPHLASACTSGVYSLDHMGPVVVEVDSCELKALEKEPSVPGTAAEDTMSTVSGTTNINDLDAMLASPAQMTACSPGSPRDHLEGDSSYPLEFSDIQQQNLHLHGTGYEANPYKDLDLGALGNNPWVMQALLRTDPVHDPYEDTNELLKNPSDAPPISLQDLLVPRGSSLSQQQPSNAAHGVNCFSISQPADGVQPATVGSTPIESDQSHLQYNRHGLAATLASGGLSNVPTSIPAVTAGLSNSFSKLNQAGAGGDAALATSKVLASRADHSLLIEAAHKLHESMMRDSSGAADSGGIACAVKAATTGARLSKTGDPCSNSNLSQSGTYMAELPSVQLLRVISKEPRSMDLSMAQLLTLRPSGSERPTERSSEAPAQGIPPPKGQMYCSYPPANPVTHGPAHSISAIAGRFDYQRAQQMMQATTAAQKLLAPLAARRMISPNDSNAVTSCDTTTIPPSTSSTSGMPPLPVMITRQVTSLQGSGSTHDEALQVALREQSIAAAAAGASALAHLQTSQSWATAANAAFSRTSLGGSECWDPSRLRSTTGEQPCPWALPTSAPQMAPQASTGQSSAQSHAALIAGLKSSGLLVPTVSEPAMPARPAAVSIPVRQHAKSSTAVSLDTIKLSVTQPGDAAKDKAGQGAGEPPKQTEIVAAPAARVAKKAAPEKKSAQDTVKSEARMDEWEAANKKVDQEAAAAVASKAIANAGPAYKPSNKQLLVIAHEQTFADTLVTQVMQTVTQKNAPQPGFFARLFCLAPAAPPPAFLQTEKGQILCWAKTAYSDKEQLHWDLLVASYCAFTGCDAAPGRKGSHWAALGWQGSDPATDLRGCGVLGLIQLVSLHCHHPGNAAAMYTLSRSSTQEYPLAVVSLNMTKFTLQALRAGHLDSKAGQLGSMWQAAAHFHAGGMYLFHQQWVAGKHTMVQSGFVMKEIETTCKSRPAAVLKAACLQLSA